jgi:hypothetical protein
MHIPAFVPCRFFCVDTESKDGKLVFNRTVTLKASIPGADAGAAAGSKGKGGK